MNRRKLHELAVTAGKLLFSGVPPELDPAEQQALIDLIDHHQLLPLLHWRLSRNSDLKSRFVASDMNRMRQASHRIVAEQVRNRSVLAQALELLAEFDPILFKGLAAAEQWPDTALRPPGDIDLLVSPEAFSDAATALESNGWVRLPTVHSELDGEVAARYGFAAMYRHPSWSLAVDLHRSIIDDTEPFGMDAESLRKASCMVELQGGITARTPSPGHHVALMALHSVRQGLFRWVHFLDLAYWRGAMSDKNNIVISEYARTNAVIRPVRVAFLAAETLLSTPLYPDALGRPTAGDLRAARRRGPDVLANGRFFAPDGLRRVHALLDLLPSCRQRTRYTQKVLLPDRELVGRSGTIPHGMHYLIHRSRAMIRMLQSFMRSEKDS